MCLQVARTLVQRLPRIRSGAGCSKQDVGGGFLGLPTVLVLVLASPFAGAGAKTYARKSASAIAEVVYVRGSLVHWDSSHQLQ